MNPISRQRGFTLIEMLIAIAVMAILMAVAAPSFNAWLAQANLKAEAREVLGAFQRARSEAVSRNTDIVLTFVEGIGDAGTWKIFIDNGEGAGGVASDYIQNGDEQLIGNGSMQNRMGITNADFNGDSDTGFNSRGLPLPLEDGSVEVTDGGSTYEISLTAAGNVKIERI